MFDGEKLQILLQKEKNIILKDLFSYKFSNPAEKFEFLISIRHEVDLEAYATFVRMLTQMNTQNVPLEVLLKAYEGLKPNDLMCKDEIDRLLALSDELTIYRGTDASEYYPRISWTLLESKARTFENGRLYRAIVNKRDIFAYYSINTNEEEIIAHVTKNFDVIL